MSTKRSMALHFHNQTVVTIISLSGIIVGSLLIIISLWANVSSPLKEIVMAIGIALAPSGVIGWVFDYLVSGRTMELLHDSNEKLNEQVEALRVSTDFLKQSSTLGLEMIYPDRRIALEEFAPFMREQAEKSRDGKLIIVGSSVKGLREAIRHWDTIIESASRNVNCTFQIMLTHPEYCRFRENQEERPAGAIEQEIFESILYLEEHWSKGVDPIPSKSINHNVKFYKGTPTCFMVIAGDRMLINPYPYEKEAYKSFCLLVKEPNTSDTEEMPRSIYQQYYINHFEIPWARNALAYRHFNLQGPIPRSPERYGDVFVVQDSGKFHLTIVLIDKKKIKDSESLLREDIRGIPPSIPYMKHKDGSIKTLQIGNELTVKLLRVTPDANATEDRWRDLSTWGRLRLDADKRSGKFSAGIEGDFMSEYDMLGLFDEVNISPFCHADFANRKDLQNHPLPMFWYWVDKDYLLEEEPLLPEIKIPV